MRTTVRAFLKPEKIVEEKWRQIDQLDKQKQLKKQQLKKQTSNLINIDDDDDYYYKSVEGDPEVENPVNEASLSTWEHALDKEINEVFTPILMSDEEIKNIRSSNEFWESKLVENSFNISSLIFTITNLEKQ